MRTSRTSEDARAERGVVRPRRLLRHALPAALSLALACSPDSGQRWSSRPPDPPRCRVGDHRCHPELERCDDGPDGPDWKKIADCSGEGLVCSAFLGECAVCAPETPSCDGPTPLTCREDGSGYERGETCDESEGEACRAGRCENPCAVAAEHRSNVGCEYWAVDLDNARVDDMLNAAAQQFAVVVSNVQPDVTADVTIEQDDTAPGESNDPFVVASASIPPLSLRVFRLGPREVDGSPPGEFNTGTHTALTRAAYRVRSTFPVVAYQFNPLANVGVFSNDASLLKPLEAVTPPQSGMLDAYVAIGWPQTIATTDDPRTNFSSRNPIDLRAFLTIVGTRDDTTVRVVPTARVLGAPGVPETNPGEELEVSLGPFDVLNLETDDFNADFTGSVISADGPVIAFTGSEASDAPYFETLSDRYCCADHLEEQLDHLRTAGREFVVSATPNRSRALKEAGAAVGVASQREYFRLLATTHDGAFIRTSHEDYPELELFERGDYADLVSEEPFTIVSDAPVMLLSVTPSQQAATLPGDLPGGDPSMIIIPPVEQFRSSYVFLTPDQYAFDFVRIIAPEDAAIVFDSLTLEDMGCSRAPAGAFESPLGAVTAYDVHTCQLGFPVVDPNARPPDNISRGTQYDGVHVIESDRRIGVLVNGFDGFVGYAYAAGTELEFIVER